MTYQIRIAGFGGQGVMVLGQMLAWSATHVGLNAMFVPTYGPETRGGTANCMVTISDERIFYQFLLMLIILLPLMNHPLISLKIMLKIPEKLFIIPV